MSGIRLIAFREMKQLFTSKAFIWSTVIVVVAIIATAFLMNNVAKDADKPYSLGITNDDSMLTEGLRLTLEAIDREAKFTVITEEEGREELISGDLDALLIGPSDDFRVVTKDSLDYYLESALTMFVQQEALSRYILELGGSATSLEDTLTSRTLDIESIKPPEEIDSSRIIAGMLCGVLLFVGILGGGQLIAQGVVEEKSSRVVELLLATVKPWQLMTGKILGIGTAAFTQVALFVATAYISFQSTSLSDRISFSMGGVAFSIILWFLIGFTTYAILLAALASLVSRQEEVSSVVTPVMIILMIPYFASVTVAPQEPNGAIMTWLSQLPLTAPLSMPTRLAVTTVPTSQLALALVLNILLIPALIWLASKIYSNAILRTGARIKLSEALKSH